VRWLLQPLAPPPAAFAAFGDDSWLVPPATVAHPERIHVGHGVVVLEHSSLLAGPVARLVIGDRARLGRLVSITATTEVVIGDEVMSSDGVIVGDGVVVGAGAYLGANAVLLDGAHVGAGAYVGEGAVVDGPVPARAVVRGSPAVVVDNVG
jgi:acetyltransferase-like isoleucine patch superfamily enzyme